MTYNVLNRDQILENNNKFNWIFQPFNDNVHGPIYTKQFLFPSLTMDINIRIDIIRESINYVILTKRFNDP